MSAPDSVWVVMVRLLVGRRFAAHFFTQLLGAFNDNVFKQALIIFIVFQAASSGTAQSAQLVTVAGGIFALPFFLGSPIAGQLADKYPKTLLIRWIKAAEVVIMLAAAAAFWSQSLELLLLVLFVMGLQSTMFGPLKYGILPQLIRCRELPAGNGLVQAATYLAILFGTMFGGLLMAEHGLGWQAVCVAVVALAVAGLLASCFIPAVPAAVPALELDFNIIRQGLLAVGFAREAPAVFAAIVGISWFWFLGATNLQLLPTYGREILAGNAKVVTLLLVTFAVGIGLGALGSAALMRVLRPMQLVGGAALGMAVFGALQLAAYTLADGIDAAAGSLGLAELLARPATWPALASFLGLAVCGGLYVVPQFVIVQTQSRLERRSRIIAANNIMNALFMVASAVCAYALIGVGLSLPAILALTAAGSLVVVAIIARRLREDVVA